MAKARARAKARAAGGRPEKAARSARSTIITKVTESADDPASGAAGGGAPGREPMFAGRRSRPQVKAGRPTDWTQAKADKFIEVLADSCNVSLAARAIRRSVSNVYKQRQSNATFRAAWDQALAIGYARLEMMMLERALHGVEKTVKLTSGESRIMREYNDRVALALLRHHRDSVGATESRLDDDDYQEACQRIIDKLARLRERDLGEGPVERKDVADRLKLIALALRGRRQGQTRRK